MTSQDLKNILNRGWMAVKRFYALTGSTSAAVTVYFKPTFPCRVVGLKLKTTVNSGNAEGVAVTKVTDAKAVKYLRPDEFVLGDATINAGVVAVSNSAVFNGTTIAAGTSNYSAVDFVPGANNDAEAAIDIDAGEALKIVLDRCASTAIIGNLELELQPL